jgi:predicted nucleic acid-binding protein
VRTREQKQEANRRYYWKHHQKSLEARRRWRENHHTKAVVHKHIVREAVVRAQTKEEAATRIQRNIESTRFWWGQQ